MDRDWSISLCPRFTTGTYPRRKGITRPAKISTTSVPWSLEYVLSRMILKYLIVTHIKSTFVNTPIVLVPSGSTSLASFSPSEFAKSVFAAVTAKMIHAGFEIYLRSISRICFSISRGWSPTGTRVTPGRSTSVRVRTFGEKTRRLMGTGEMPAFLPVFASVSRTISVRILLKS
jgi:hypothetical protein